MLHFLRRSGSSLKGPFVGMRGDRVAVVKTKPATLRPWDDSLRQPAVTGSETLFRGALPHAILRTRRRGLISVADVLGLSPRRLFDGVVSIPDTMA